EAPAGIEKDLLAIWTSGCGIGSAIRLLEFRKVVVEEAVQLANRDGPPAAGRDIGIETDNTRRCAIRRAESVRCAGIRMQVLKDKAALVLGERPEILFRDQGNCPAVGAVGSPQSGRREPIVPLDQVQIRTRHE